MINFGKTNSWHFHFNFINSLGLKPFPIREGRGDKMLKKICGKIGNSREEDGKEEDKFKIRTAK